MDRAPAGLTSDPVDAENNFNPFTTRNRMDGGDMYSLESPSKDKIGINDFLHPITEIRQIRRLKFEPESPRFAQACQRLKIDMKDIEKRRLADFEAQIRDEKPEEDQNPALIRELAMIRYNYHLTTFKEVFNDVIEERKHIIKEEFISGGSQVISPQKSLPRMGSGGLLRVNQSQSTLKSRIQVAAMSRDRSGGRTAIKNANKNSSIISTSASVMALPSKTVLLTEND